MSYWIRVTGWIIIRPKIALAVKIRNQECRKRRERPKTLPKESDLNCRAVAILLKAVCCFLQLSRGLEVGKSLFWKVLLNSPGLLKSISSSLESLVTLKILRLIFVSCGFGVRSNSGISERFTDYQRKVIVLNCLQTIRCYYLSVIDWNVFIEVINWYYWMCGSEPAILSAVIVFLTVIILLLLYLLTEKICLWEINSNALPDTKFLQFT